MILKFTVPLLVAKECVIERTARIWGLCLGQVAVLRAR